MVSVPNEGPCMLTLPTECRSSLTFISC